MIKTIIALAIAAAIPTVKVPKPPEVCEPDPVLDSYFCPNSDVNYVFTVKVGCEKPVLAFHSCNVVDTEDPANLRPEPLRCDAPGADAEFCVDPQFDENEAPGEGPPGAPTVDHP